MDSDGVFLVKTARMAVTEFLSNGKRMKLESEEIHKVDPMSIEHESFQGPF